jgi:alpha-glucosidase
MTHSSRKTFLAFLFAIIVAVLGSASARAVSSEGGIAVEAVTSFQHQRDGVEIKTASTSLRITALRDDILRVRIAPGGAFPEDSSWAVLSGPRGKSVNVQPIEVKPTDSQSGQEAAFVGFRTSSLEVRIERNPLRIVVLDLAGNIISADAVGRPTEFRVGGFSVHKAMPPDEHYFGLGDKAGTFDRRDQAYTLWNTDIGTQESIDPIYKSIPFFLAIGGGRSYGLFLDNTWRTWFDFGKQARDTYSFGAEGGPLNYYLIYGPSPKQVVEGYTYLTGTHPLPPLWALGFQQSRYSYFPESQIREIADRFRADKIPADVLYLDIDYQYKNRPFTVDPQTFPNFPGLISDLRKQHFHLVLITDLHIARVSNQGYAPYDSGEAGNHFVKKADGSEFVGIVWPGPAVFPDFTRAQTRDWWGGLYKDFVQTGIAGFWNDMNEPSVFDGPAKTMPLDNIHRIEEPGFATRTATHYEIHNIVGLENARATYEGLLKLRPNERPFVLTRATYAGGQRYGFTWTGDNSSTWNHLRLATQQLLNLGLSGISFVGDDIGGFNASPPPDLLTRWIEVGAFNPMFRDHTTKGSLMQEVWVHGPEQEAIRRRYIETRYRLLPYIYTLAEESTRTGLPMMRPIFLEFPEVFTPPSNGFGNLDTEFLLGPSLLVAPQPFAETLDDYVVSFPKGQWYDFWTGLKVPAPPPEPTIVQIASAGTEAVFPAPAKIHPVLDTLPVYVRGGSILPLQPLIQSTDETPSGPLELRVYPGEQCSGSLYLDDGHTLGYQRGEFLRQTFSCKSDGDSLRVNFSAREGTYAPWWKTVEVVIYGWPSAQAEVRLSKSTSPPRTFYDASTSALHVLIPDIAGEIELQIGSPPAR